MRLRLHLTSIILASHVRLPGTTAALQSHAALRCSHTEQQPTLRVNRTCRLCTASQCRRRAVALRLAPGRHDPRDPRQIRNFAASQARRPVRSPAAPNAMPPLDTEPSGQDSELTALNHEELEDEGYGASDAASFMTSILSSIRRGVEENGRIYPAYGRHEYGMPIDEKELDRMDLQHHKFNLLLNDRLFIAPISDQVLDRADSRVLDIGTGSGIWAIDMADKYAAEIIGCDIAAIQPSLLPPNCIFEIDDAESDWLYPSDHFNFVHCRDCMTAIRDWPRLIEQSHTALRPGGWIELSSTIPEMASDDGTLPPDSAFKAVCDIFYEIATSMNTDLNAPRSWKDQLEAAGFVNVEDVVLKMPSGPWTRDRRLRVVGALEQQMLYDNLEAFLVRGYTQILGRSREQLEVLCALARKELLDPTVHMYALFHVTYGQKGESRDE